MKDPLIVDGWLKVPCDAPDMATVELAVGRSGPPRQWRPGFRDWHDGVRVAQVRVVPPPGTWRVWVRVDGHVGPARVLRIGGKR